mgnify:FL=1
MVDVNTRKQTKITKRIRALSSFPAVFFCATKETNKKAMKKKGDVGARSDKKRRLSSGWGLSGKAVDKENRSPNAQNIKQNQSISKPATSQPRKSVSPFGASVPATPAVSFIGVNDDAKEKLERRKSRIIANGNSITVEYF